MKNKHVGETTLTWAERMRLPQSWQSLADQLKVPVLIVDYQITRRQRVHVGHLPNRDDPYVSGLLLEVLEFLWNSEYEQGVVVYEPRKGEPMTAQIAFAPLTTEDITDG